MKNVVEQFIIGGRRRGVALHVVLEISLSVLDHRYVYDALSEEVKVSFSGIMQSSVVDLFIKMLNISLEDVVPEGEDDYYDEDEDDLSGPSVQLHTKAEMRLFERDSGDVERYRMLGDLLVTTDMSGVRFALETAGRETVSAIKSKVNKWFTDFRKNCSIFL